MFCIPSTRNNFFQTFDKKTPGQKICFIYFIFSLKKAKQRKKKDFHENVAAFISRHAKQNKTKHRRGFFSQGPPSATLQLIELERGLKMSSFLWLLKMSLRRSEPRAHMSNDI